MVLDNSVHFQTSGLTSLVWILQCGLDAFGLQRAGDWQEDGGEEDSEPGRQEERAGRETGHGLRLQEVTWQHKCFCPEITVCCICVMFGSSLNYCVCFLLQRCVSLSDVRDAGDRAGNSRRSKVLLSIQTGHVWWAGFHLWTPKVRMTPAFFYICFCLNASTLFHYILCSHPH